MREPEGAKRQGQAQIFRVIGQTETLPAAAQRIAEGRYISAVARRYYNADRCWVSDIVASRAIPSNAATDVDPEPDDAEDDGRAKRGLSSEWAGVMKRLARESSFDYDAFVTAAAKCDTSIDKAGARTRVSRYLKAGYLERIEEGVFCLTQKGREAAE